MTDPTKVERLEVERCPVCGGGNIGGRKNCYGLPSNKHEPTRFEFVEVIPAQEVERLEQALRELVEAFSDDHGFVTTALSAAEIRRQDAALSQAREIVMAVDWKAHYEEQIKITDLLRADLAQAERALSRIAELDPEREEIYDAPKIAAAGLRGSKIAGND